MRRFFLGIGAQKCGTSWLYRNLQAHPEIWLPPEKELHFFDERIHSELPLWRRILGRTGEAERWRRQVNRQIKKFRRGQTDRSLTRWYLRYFLGNADADWYARLFARAGDRVTGDITPDYSVLTGQEIRSARSMLPDDTRLILLIRNPIERIWSHAKMEERLLDRPATQAASELLERPRARQLTDYLSTIEAWTSQFPAAQLFVGFMEDIALDPVPLLHAITDFLEVGRFDDYPAATRIVHEGGHDTMPVETGVALARELEDEIIELDRRLGGHASWWRYTASELLADPPTTATLVYPLWESQLRERWEASAVAATVDSRSGPLPGVESAAGRS